MLAPWLEWPLLVMMLVVFYRGEQILVDPMLRYMKAGSDESLKSSIMRCMYWIGAAVVFNLVVWGLSQSSAVAEAWTSGYVLEYTLSLDNLFIFQWLLKMYDTPTAQVDKALVFGIGAAAVLRFVFFILGTSLFEWVSWVRLPFGLLLLWTAYKTAMAPSSHKSLSPIEPGNWSFLKKCEKYLPFIAQYDRNGKFFQFTDSHDWLGPGSYSRQSTPPTTPALGPQTAPRSLLDIVKLRVTMLGAVVVALALVDIVFALDAVAAKVTQTHDLFINFSSSVFAMTGFRSLYFVLVEMTLTFKYLKYGVALVLAYVAVELMLSIWVAIPNSVSCVIILSICALSIVASLFVSGHDKTTDNGIQMQNVVFGLDENDDEDIKSPLRTTASP